MAEIEAHRDRLIELSLKIHDNPELGYQEKQAAEWLTGYLKENGFSVEQGVCGLPTAFRADYGQGSPVIAILAEYDALPGLGHACGHNIIAASAVGVGVASRLASDKFGGTIMVIGTPAEEIHGGKIVMAERGAFNNVDAAMMVHPSVINTATTRFLACQTLEVEFFGKEAHAAAMPEKGINALDAMVQSFTAINALRQHIQDKARIHGIITNGGEAANIIPAHSAGNFIIRAEEDDYLEEIKQRALDCFAGAATATGARLEYRWGDTRYSSMRNNLSMARLFRQNLQSLGRRTQLADPSGSFGSSDMGNVSQLVPSIHPCVAIAPKKVSVHSPQFAQAAASEAGHSGMIDAARAMAMTVVELLSSPETVTKIKDEFRQGK